jgi:signal peptidase I
MDNLDLDFSALLVGLTLLTGIIWGVDRWLFAPRRVRNGGEQVKEPIIVEYSRSFFPVILVVLIIRSFLAEPFRIPSDSMMPTLLDGDFILVNKFAYGIRLPVVNEKVISVGEPSRGDVMVFRYPGDPNVPNDPEKGQDFIKRVIGLPGDRVAYRDHTLYVNGEKVLTELVDTYHGASVKMNYEGFTRWRETSPELTHEVLLGQHPYYAFGRQGEWSVPDGNYLVMGDNRGNSKDSRVWGTVPEENLVGRAFLIWMSWDFVAGKPQFGRIGTVIK